MKIAKAKSVDKIVMKTKSDDQRRADNTFFEWWTADSPEKRGVQLVSTANYLKQNQTWRIRQIAVDIRMYSGLSVYSYAGSNVSKMDQTKSLPDDRPTFNLIQSCVDTLVSRLGQSRPAPVFLTDGSDYRQRHIAQQLNKFVLGEFYQTKAYEKGVKMLRDGLVTGTGCLKVYADNDRVRVDRVLCGNLYTDEQDSLDGNPTQLYELRLLDRDLLIKKYPKYTAMLKGAPNAYSDNSAGNAQSTADQIMVVEGWKLASSDEAKDGCHTIACTAGVFCDEVYEKTKFPFVWFMYSEPFLGFFGKGISRRLFGTQLTLNRILYTIARAITLVGVPRVFIEQGSKVSKASMNNEIGVMIPYFGVKPSYEVAPCNAPELYSERDRLIQFGFQQEGVSMMAASSAKPPGVDSGEALRAYDNISTDRFASIARKYDTVFIDLAYLVVETAVDIAKKTGSYETVFPSRDGTKEIDLPNIKFIQDPFVIQCFSESSLPKDPAGRMQKVTEMVQAGMISLKEGRRLMNYPDLDQMERLANASEERIFQYLDKIVEDGKYNPPDAFMDLQLATELTTQYYNLYVSAKLEESKAQQLRTFFTQSQALLKAAIPPPPPQAQANPAQAMPAPLPTSQLVPNAVAPTAAA